MRGKIRGARAEFTKAGERRIMFASLIVSILLVASVWYATTKAGTSDSPPRFHSALTAR